MKEIHYTEHLNLRLKLREIPYNLPRKIYREAKERYFDNETKKIIAIKEIKYKNRTKEIALIYEETLTKVNLITIHPLKVYQKLGRIKSGRWQKL